MAEDRRNPVDELAATSLEPPTERKKPGVSPAEPVPVGPSATVPSLDLSTAADPLGATVAIPISSAPKPASTAGSQASAPRAPSPPPVASGPFAPSGSGVPLADPLSTDAFLAQSDSLAATAMDPLSSPGTSSVSRRVNTAGSSPGSSSGGVSSDRHRSLLDGPSPDAIPGARAGAHTLEPFGPFSRVELLAEQGAMGLVARGYNEAFDRWELLKFLKPELASEAELLRQFQREGRMLARLSHPNVVQVFATYQVDGQPCLAMEFLAGESLGSLIEKNPTGIPITQWYELFVDAVRGMAAAHDLGLLHRDIKPDNLFVIPERKGGARGLKLIDFGLATADRAKIDLESSDRSLLAQTRGGTPLYMAPELWRGEDASPRSDVFAMGMTFFNAATGGFPFEISTMPLVVMTMSSPDPFASVRETRRDLPPAFAQVIDRALAKRKEDRFATADELVAALVAAASAARPRRVPGSGPYRGLERFSAAERDVFFGRDEEIAEVLERLRNQPGVLLVGPSGAGKSSLVHAGVVPSVEDGALGGGFVFRSAAIEPRAHPCASLAAGLAIGTGAPEKDLLAFLRTTPEKTGEALREALPPATGLILVLDQLEELTTLATDPREIRDFCVAIAAIFEVLSPQLRVLGTVRADLMDRLFVLEPLRPFFTRGFYPVRPMGEVALRRALEEPAKAAGYTLEDSRIADAIVADVSRTAAGLPLMSFAMASWWKARDEVRKVLPTAAWQALGGLGGALAKHGDSVLDSMSADERTAAEAMIPRLISPENTRTRASRASLVDPASAGPGATRALDLLLQSKLVLESGGEIELAHETLITQWPRLRAMLDVAGDDRVFRERVASAARDWDMQGRPDGALWTDAQAVRLMQWFTSTHAALGQQELAFVEAVRRAGAWRKLLLRSLVASGLLVAITLALVASRSERKLAANLDEAKKSVAETEKKFKRAESERLRMHAELLLKRDPAKALRTVLESHSLLPDPSTDPIAWQARSLGVATPLPIHAGGTTMVRVSSNASWIATAGTDGTVHVLSATNSEHTVLRPGKAGSVPRTIAFDPTGGMLAMGESGGEIVVASPPKFAPVALSSCESSTPWLAWLRPGVLLVQCSDHDDVIASTLDVASRKLTTLYKGPSAVWARASDLPIVLAVSPDGVLRWIDTVSGKVTESKPDPKLRDVSAVALSADASILVVGDAKGALLTAPIKDGRPGNFRALSPHEGAVSALSFSPTGALVSISERGPARLWDATLEHAVSLDDATPILTWIPSRGALALASPTGEIHLVSIAARSVVARLPGYATSSLAASKDGEWLFSSSLDGASRAYAVDDVLPRVIGLELPQTKAKSPGSTPPVLSSAPSKTLAPATASSAATPASAVADDPDHVVCTVAVDGTAAACFEPDSLRIEPIEGSSVRDLKPRRVPISSTAQPIRLALGPKGQRFAWVNRGGAVTVDGAPFGPEITNALLAFSSSRGHLAIAGNSARKPVLQLSLVGGAPAPAMPVITTTIRGLAFAHDDASLFVATDDGTVTEIEIATGEAHAVLHLSMLGMATITGLTVAEDGSSVAVADSNGRIFVAPINGTKPPKESLSAMFAPPLACLTFTQGARAIVFAGRTQPLAVQDLDSPARFDVVDPVAPMLACARSPIDDRISFVTAERTAWIRSLDLTPATMSRPPEDALDARTSPVELWPGLPKRNQ